jgi:hypothetical protein
MLLIIRTSVGYAGGDPFGATIAPSINKKSLGTGQVYENESSMSRRKDHQ